MTHTHTQKKKKEGGEKTNDDDGSRGGPERRADWPLGGREAKDAGVGAVLGEERVKLRKAGGLGLREDERRLHAERHLGALAAGEECGLRLRYHASRMHAGALIHAHTHAHAQGGKGMKKEGIKKKRWEKSQSCHNSSIEKRKIWKGKGYSPQSELMH